MARFAGNLHMGREIKPLVHVVEVRTSEFGVRRTQAAVRCRKP
jgi:hypothetical protein